MKVAQKRWTRLLYENSLAIAFFGFFLLSFALHALGGKAEYNQVQIEHGSAPVSLVGFIGTSEFWFQSLQNYQSEFFALGALAVLTIFLRQKGSHQSKPVQAPVAATAH
jgi:hypothetical protein